MSQTRVSLSKCTCSEAARINFSIACPYCYELMTRAYERALSERYARVELNFYHDAIRYTTPLIALSA